MKKELIQKLKGYMTQQEAQIYAAKYAGLAMNLYSAGKSEAFLIQLVAVDMFKAFEDNGWLTRSPAVEGAPPYSNEPIPAPGDWAVAVNFDKAVLTEDGNWKDITPADEYMLTSFLGDFMEEFNIDTDL